MNKILFTLVYGLLSISLNAQDSINWWEPVTHNFLTIEGQAWPSEVSSTYDRLPKRAKNEVRKPVWNLSRQASGLKIRFRSNAEEIVVRYTVTERKAMDHMPATGVSGIDLYAVTSSGASLWCMGRRTFSDTITYRFSGLNAESKFHKFGNEYRLDLPLYNAVEWLEIGTPKNTYFEPLPVRNEKPIVVYGTSIAQGACASRPGMAWTNILGRKMDRPLINLAFSGNGKLEPELIGFVKEIDAKIYILDCLPNLWRENELSDADLENRIIKSVTQLHTTHPNTPILLTAHAGYTDGFTNTERANLYTRVNNIQFKTYEKLITSGVKNLHYLSFDEIGLNIDAMVDGTHPNDLGMMQYANAYEKKLRFILNEPKGVVSTAIPITQLRELGGYDWEKRHASILEMNTTTPPKKVFLANSIVHFWGGLPVANTQRDEASWKKYFTPMGLRNFAYGWDRIENVLWRVYHGELDGFNAEQVIIMIGTNNLHINTDDEIISGLKFLLNAVKNRQPKAQITILGLLPRRDQEKRLTTLNKEIKALANSLQVKYEYIGNNLINAKGELNETLFSDGLHPNKKGYKIMQKALLPLLSKDN